MKASKRKRLQTAGWKVGDSRSFLGLSDGEAALVEMKLALARPRRRARHGERLQAGATYQPPGTSSSAAFGPQVPGSYSWIGVFAAMAGSTMRQASST